MKGQQPLSDLPVNRSCPATARCGSQCRVSHAFAATPPTPTRQAKLRPCTPSCRCCWRLYWWQTTKFIIYSLVEEEPISLLISNLVFRKCHLYCTPCNRLRSNSLTDGNIPGLPPFWLDPGATVSFDTEWHRKSSTSWRPAKSNFGAYRQHHHSLKASSPWW